MHPYTQALLEAVPVPDPELEAKKARKIIKGEVPSLMQRPEGCAFSTRCPYATDQCRKAMPVLEEKEPGHRVACWKNMDQR